MKHHVLDNSSKFIGAYNPKEKLNKTIEISKSYQNEMIMMKNILKC